MRTQTIFRDNTAFLVLVIVVLAMGAPQAAAKGETAFTYEADSLMRTCEIRYKSGQYENALKVCYRANAIYAKIPDDFGIRKSNEQISEIESLLSDNQLAQFYYNIGSDYYLETETDIEVLEQAVFFAEKAMTIYDRLGGQIGVKGKLKCENLIEEANRKIRDERNKCIKEGDEMYQQARNAFFLNDYLVARAHATNASAVYTNCPYQAGVYKTADLLTSINNKLQEIKAEAKAAYDQAINYYTQKKAELCMSRASESQALYLKIGDQEGVDSATNVLSECNKDQDAAEDGLKRQADKLKKEAEYFAVIPDCMNATDRANRAKEIYESLKKRWYEKEYHLPASKQHKTNYYQTFIHEVNAILQKITSTCNEKRMLQIAEDYYRQSQEYYLNNDLNDALSYAINARNIFTQLKNYVGISKADTLISQIQMRISQMNEADSYFQNAKQWYHIAQFDEAMISANKALAVYRNIKKQNRIEEVEALIKEIRVGQEDLAKANTYFAKAQGHFEVEDWTQARDKSKTAYDLYVKVNYTIGVEESDRIIGISQDQIDKENAEFQQMVIFIVVLVVLSAVLVMQLTKRKKVLEQEYAQRRHSADEESRRMKEEWEIRSQGETTSRVEDELKRLIGTERDKLDDDEEEE